MVVLIAIGHIAGAVIASFVIGVLTHVVAAWDGERAQKRALEEMSITLGVPVYELDSESLAPRVIQPSSARFSSDLLRNRLSDLCGVLRTIWAWFGWLVEAGIVIGVAWFTFTDELSMAVYAWSIVPVALFVWISSIVFSFACKLLTGRYPGQAKRARSALTQLINARASPAE